MANQTLMQIAGDLRAVLDLIDEEGGELSQIVDQWHTDITLNLAQKVDAYHGRIEQLWGMADVARKRAQDAQKAAQTIEHIAEELEGRIKFTMREMGIQELRGDQYRFKMTGTKGRLILQEEKVPAEYKIQVTKWDLDKERIRNAIEDGKEVPGAAIEPGFALRTYKVTT